MRFLAALRAIYSKILIPYAGYTLVAVSPQSKDKALQMRTENNLANLVQLQDVSNEFARRLGLVFDLGPQVTTLYKQFGITTQSFFNHDGPFEIPIPATFVINKEGVVTYTFADADYAKRAEPSAVIAAL